MEYETLLKALAANLSPAKNDVILNVKPAQHLIARQAQRKFV
jgi:hypothetical protein